MTQAMIFPGQGSQSVGMLGELSSDKITLNLCRSASDVLGYDVHALIESDPKNQLNQTAYTQPALLLSSVAFYRHWLSLGKRAPSVMAGHSLGEWSALVCAGAIDFETAIRLVQKRGELMQAAGDQRPGSMAAILGLSDEQVLELCASVSDGEVSPANYNSPGQVVISGDNVAVDEVVAAAKLAGAKLAKKLAVSVASHSPLMAPAAIEFSSWLEKIEFTPPSIPVLHNYDVLTHTDSATIRKVLVSQLISPVRWVECMLSLSDYHVSQAVECGPGNILTGLAKRMKPAIAAQGFFTALKESV
jgi:[acyl-carrier-protein] S-malonyltransferase